MILKKLKIVKERFKKNRFIKEESGNAIVFFSLYLVILIGVAGLVIDTGVLYLTKSHLKKTANAVVLSGAQELTNSTAAVNVVVTEILNAHGEESSLKDISIVTTYPYRISVTLEKEVKLYFFRIFKMYSQKVAVTSSVQLVPMKSGVGAVPLGIDKDVPLEYLKEYTLKVDSGDSEYGNFGVLALQGPGAKLYEQDLMYGYDGELEVGDIINTQTGNIAGKTVNAVNYRINSCSHPSGDYTNRDCERIILVLVYEPYEFNGHQLDKVKISGFAYFYLKEPVNQQDSTIKGYFIKRAGTGFGNESVRDTGAYTIKLSE
jgi:hypothetical protein